MSSSPTQGRQPQGNFSNDEDVLDEDYLNSSSPEEEEERVAPKQEKTGPKPAKGRKNKLARRKRPSWLDEDRIQDEKQMAQGNLMMQQQQQQQQQVQQQDSGKKDALKLRLDLNLEIEIELKARIHGDLTLSLLN